MHIRWSAYRYPISDWQVKHLCRPEVASKPAPKQKTPMGLLSLNTVQNSYLFVLLIRCYVPPHTMYSSSHFSRVNFFFLGVLAAAIIHISMLWFSIYTAFRTARSGR
ncbi:hypothetical protein BKA59DRAFT_151256 [Fusarium tricinctum]|uniref:Uncharacterized protein n=1 Tax=Fusarium tricinctum TaxID=61284 RepID=A0A8K0WD97_9HYPO|nr:hypothetical protein BKA59DRAFT_151256 [Fusarium tricinctum]